MKVSRTASFAGLVVVGALALTACGSDNNNGSSNNASKIDCATGDLKGAGSTFQNNIMSEWIKTYGNACSGATIDYQSIGSGAGISQFGAGTTDFAGSDSTMKPDEQAAADKRCGSPALHLPVTAGAVAIAYNLSGVDSLQLSPATLAGIFQGTITKWDDAAVKADNPGASLPSTGITAVHREDASGTTDVFSKFLSATAGAGWKLGKGKELSWPTKVQGAKGSDGVTQAVKAADGGITYTEVSYVENAGLQSAKVKNAGGEYAGPDGDAVSSALAGAELPASGNDLKVGFDFTKVDQGYPITALSYEIVCSKATDATKQKLLKSFLTYAVTTGQDAATPNGYAPMPSSIVDRVKTAVAGLS